MKVRHICPCSGDTIKSLAMLEKILNELQNELKRLSNRSRMCQCQKRKRHHFYDAEPKIKYFVVTSDSKEAKVEHLDRLLNQRDDQSDYQDDQNN